AASAATHLVILGLRGPRYCVLLFFFQAEDGIRDATVTGVQTCALPILLPQRVNRRAVAAELSQRRGSIAAARQRKYHPRGQIERSEERRVGKEGRYRCGRDQKKRDRDSEGKRREGGAGERVMNTRQATR